MILTIIFVSIVIYYLGATYVISSRFARETKALNYWYSLTIFGFFIKMAIKHPYKGHRISNILSVIFLYQIFTEILKVYYHNVYMSHPSLDPAYILPIAKRKFEEGIENVYQIINSNKL